MMLESLHSLLDAAEIRSQHGRARRAGSYLWQVDPPCRIGSVWSACPGDPRL